VSSILSFQKDSAFNIIRPTNKAASVRPKTSVVARSLIVLLRCNSANIRLSDSRIMLCHACLEDAAGCLNARGCFPVEMSGYSNNRHDNRSNKRDKDDLEVSTVSCGPE
jgi:tRNA-binding EMAP/Myf-like protein